MPCSAMGEGFALLSHQGEIVLSAVSQNWWALKWASEELKEDDEICAAACGSPPVAFVLRVMACPKDQSGIDVQKATAHRIAWEKIKTINIGIAHS